MIKEEVALIIPARIGSTRLNGKPLAMLGNKTMIEHVYGRVASCGFENCYVATDSQEIVDVITAMGGHAIMTDPNCECGTDRVWDAYTKLEHKEKIKFVVNIQGDMPFIDPDVILHTVQTLVESGDDIATPAVKVGREVAFKDSNVKLVVDKNKDVLYFSRCPIPHDANEYLYHIGIYGFKVNALEDFVKLPVSTLEKQESIEPLRALHNGMSIRAFFADSIPISVDTQEDLELAQNFLYSTD